MVPLHFIKGAAESDKYHIDRHRGPGVGGEFDLVLVMLGTNDQGYNNPLGTIADTTGDVAEIAMTWDADTSTVRVYEDGILIGEAVTTVPLKFDGLRIQGNYQTDEQAGSCPAEYVEIYRGVIEI